MSCRNRSSHVKPFGHETKQRKFPMSAPKALLVTTVKNEGPNILEWVAHHLLVGFDAIQIFQNDSDDETAKHLRTLAGIGAIEYYRNPTKNRDWQNRAYRRASRSELYTECEWCMALDGDEFLNVHIGGLKDLIAKCDGADEILVNWRVFGNSGQVGLSDELVVERFTMAESGDRVVNRVTPIKSLFRTSAFKRPGIHRAKAPKIDSPRIVNGSGLKEGEFYLRDWRSFDPAERKFAQVNHYTVRDASSYLLKSVRGSSSHPDREVGMKYWNALNMNVVEDRSLARKSGRIRAKMQELDERSNGRLSLLRENSLQLWREKLERVLATPEGRELFDAIAEGESA